MRSPSVWPLARMRADAWRGGVLDQSTRIVARNPDPERAVGRLATDDMRQITFMRDPRNPLRGWGPLQACGAAISVTVEAQEWAANFFAGNPANTVIKAATELDPTTDAEGLTEAGRIKAAWMAGAT